MSSSEESKMILRMIEEGKISVEEGARLLAALAEEAPVEEETANAVVNAGDRYLRVLVTDMTTGKQKVRVNIPVSLVSLGLRFVPKSANFDADAVQQAIESGYVGRVVEVQDDDDSTRVELFIE